MILWLFNKNAKKKKSNCIKKQFDHTFIDTDNSLLQNYKYTSANLYLYKK